MEAIIENVLVRIEVENSTYVVEPTKTKQKENFYSIHMKPTPR